MKFQPTEIAAVVEIEMQPAGDQRGSFMRTYCARAFAEAGIGFPIAQASQSRSALKGTLRGLHFQADPEMEDKLVRCVKGAIFDVMVDLRLGSPSYGRWVGRVLSEENNRQLFAPRGFAHGFQALTDECIVDYRIGQFYEPALTRGVRFDDPAIGVDWPLPPQALSARDLGLPGLAALDPADLIAYAAP